MKRASPRSCSRPFLVVVCAISCLLGGSGAAVPYECEVGGRPGSTLLFPYFELDTLNPNGTTTLISVNNHSASATLTRVVMWSEESSPRHAFDLLLEPWEVLTLNLRDVLMDGKLPATAGPEVLEFPNCLLEPPLDHLPNHAKTDWKIYTDVASDCGGPPPTLTGPAHGFITVDVVKRCTGMIGSYSTEPRTPRDFNYFDLPFHGPGTATIKNALWGDLLIVNPEQNSAAGVEAVAIGADEAYPTLSPLSFYSSMNGSAYDKRSPLPRNWTLRFLNGGGFDGGTEVILFHGLHHFSGPCASPNLYPLEARSLTVRDESSQVVLGPGRSRSFPLATQKVKLSDLRLTSGTTAPNAAFGVLDVELANGGWVVPLMSASGRFSVALTATPTQRGCGGD